MTLSGLMVWSRLGSDVSGRLQSYSFHFFLLFMWYAATEVFLLFFIFFVYEFR